MSADPKENDLSPGKTGPLSKSERYEMLKTSPEIMPDTERHQEEEEQANFSNLIDIWLRSSLALAQKSRVQGIVTHLETLDAHLRLPHFRVAFVGMFSCGKSTLLNRLLHRSVLPSRGYPTTATITSVVAGSKEQMEVYRSNEYREREIRPVKEESWNDLLLDDQLSQVRVFPQIQLVLNHEWLRVLNMEIIDSPGVGDLEGSHATLVSETLSQCDAAILVVNAAFALSLTEVEFLKQKVLGYRIARIIVVVTKLDNIPVTERVNVFNHVCERVAQISSSILVVPAYPLVPNMTDEDALEDVRWRIEEIVTKGDRHAQRIQQAAEIIVDDLHDLIEYGHMALDSVHMDREKREESLRQAREETHTMASKWNELLIELESRRSHLYDQLHQMLYDARDQLVKTALDEISQAGDLKAWQKKFSLSLRREFLALAHRSQSFLMNAITEDIDWLGDRVFQTFGTSIHYSSIATVKSLELTPTMHETVVDLQGWYFFVRCVSGTVSTVCDLAFSPLAISRDINQLVSILSEHFFNTKVDQQRGQLSRAIEQGIDQNIEEYAQRMSVLLQQLYAKVFQDVKQTQTMWETTRYTMLEESEDNVTDEKQWEQIVKEAILLRDNILVSFETLTKDKANKRR